MKLRISETMDGFFDNYIEMENPGVVDTDRVRELTMAKLGISPAKATRRPARKLGRVLLIAATVVLALAATAVAVYQYGMKDRVVNEVEFVSESGRIVSQYSAVGIVEKAEEEEDTKLPTNPEAKALLEWQEYRSNREESEMGEMVPYDDPIRSVYGNAWSNDVAKIREIAEKYGLLLHKGVADVGGLSAFYETLGLDAFAPFIEGADESSASNASIYNDGSFQLYAVRLPFSPAEEDAAVVLFYRAMKGVFCNFYVLGDEAEVYTNEAYTTEDGITVELALGVTSSMIFAELDNCYVTIDVSGGTDPGSYRKRLDMDGLKYMAESVEFSILGNSSTDSSAEKVAEIYEETVEGLTARQIAADETERIVLEELGDWDVSSIPEGYYRSFRFMRQTEDVVYADLSISGGAFVELEYSTDRETDNSYYYLFYSRYWADDERSESCTKEVYEKEIQDRLSSAQSYAECQINGCDGYVFRDKRAGEIMVQWVDEESDVMFCLSMPAEFSEEEALTIAESVEKQ